ncbi:hypothetical protein BSZ21_17210 [Bradyrhizobium canariense]|uniref:DUF4331 family protein n=1 Tax=Bradyrhizobium canariense TaxID=255045 RepID=UPI000A18F5D0|nr:DUF4331 family protein [Bradyrhizobium canariense]OSI67347.1 hypothetical protein BSZ21_17210 [Bradyrhizobium canariense]
MSHHYSGPNVGFPRGDARLDLTDLYAFPSPADASRSVLIMNVHPSFSLLSPEPTTPEPFAADAIYEFKIDTNGDAVADIAYRVCFSAFANGRQTAVLRRVEGAEAAETANEGRLIQEWPVSMGREALVVEAEDHRFFAGWRSDPFFFDPIGAMNDLHFSGRDNFIDKDVCSIVLELPGSALGSKPFGVWARTVDRANGGWVQADRGAKPSQSIFLTGDASADYQASEPAGDSRFIPIFAHSLEHTGGYAPVDARRLAATLLPDILHFDPALPASYPGNGRALTDDVLDHFLFLLTNGRVKSDGVGPHRDLLTDFPYLGPPHTAAAERFNAYEALHGGFDARKD